MQQPQQLVQELRQALADLPPLRTLFMPPIFRVTDWLRAELARHASSLQRLQLGVSHQQPLTVLSTLTALKELTLQYHWQEQLHHLPPELTALTMGFPYSGREGPWDNVPEAATVPAARVPPLQRLSWWDSLVVLPLALTSLRGSHLILCTTGSGSS
jgi:hypothetical protein